MHEMNGSFPAIFDEIVQHRGSSCVHFESLGIAISYREIHERASRVARALRRRGIGENALVGLLFGTSPEFLYALFGTFASGGAAVPLPQPGTATLPAYSARLRHILADSNVRIVLVGDEFAPLTALSVECNVQFVRVEDLLAEDLPASPPGAISPTALALVQYGSGSTSNPKGVALTHANLLAGIEAFVEGIRLCDDDVNGQWLPLDHDIGLVAMMAATTRGLVQHLWSPTAFVESPARWLGEFAARRATIYAGPNFSYASMLAKTSDEQLRALDLSALRVALTGGELVDSDCIARFVRRFSPAGLRADVVVPVYGLAGAMLAATFPPPGRAVEVEWVDRKALTNDRVVRYVARHSGGARGIVVVGRPVLGHSLRIVGPDGLPLGNGRVGEIQMRGPAVMASYLGRSAEESGVIDGWVSTGDLGYLVEGSLRVTGRVIETHDVEAIVERIPGTISAVAFSSTNQGSEQIVVVVEATRAAADDTARIVSETVAAELGLGALDVRIVKPQSSLSDAVRPIRMRNRSLGEDLTEHFLVAQPESTPAS